MSLGIETFAPPVKVDFDPSNRDHLLALALLQLHGRQHPTIRFKLDPRQYRNAYVSLIDLYIRSTMPSEIIQDADAYAKSRDHLVIGTFIDGTNGTFISRPGSSVNEQDQAAKSV